MQQLLPNREALSTIEKRTLFFYFFKIKKGNDGAAIRQQFAQHQATCLHWLHCEYAFIGEGTDFWTHAAIFEFPNYAAVKQAIHQGIVNNNVEAIQGFAVRPTLLPSFIVFLFKLLRPIGSLLSRNAKKRTANEILESLEEEGGITPRKHQIERHLQNTRTSKAYMINFLHTFKKAQYANGANVSGATAYYRRYGMVALRSVTMQGGNLILSGRMGQPIIEVKAPKLTKGMWEGILIMEYPNPLKMFTLKNMPGYEKALRHRNAGLERTVMIISKKND